MDLRLALMCGIDIPIEECRLIIHQPTLKEIAFIGETDFFTGVQTLCIQKNMILQEDKALLENTNNFQIFMTIMSQKETADKKQSFLKILPLFFPKYKVFCTPRSLIFMQEGVEENIIVDENNFEYLQNAISTICCLNRSSNNEQDFNPGGEKAQEIMEKILRGRQRVAAQKEEKNNSVFVQYISVLTIGIPSMSLQDSMQLTMYQLYDLVERFMLYVNWDIDIRSRLAGGTPDGQTENWMKNIH